MISSFFKNEEQPNWLSRHCTYYEYNCLETNNGTDMEVEKVEDHGSPWGRPKRT